MFCAPSLHGESFGVVLLEAMAAGTPVVASGLDGYRNVATDGVDALLVAARATSTRSPPRCGACSATPTLAAAGSWPTAQARARTSSRWPRLADEYVTIYRELIARAALALRSPRLRRNPARTLAPAMWILLIVLVVIVLLVDLC